MTRLTFIKKQNGLQYFTKNFIARDKIIRGSILVNPADGIFCCLITNVDDGSFLYNEQCDNFHKAKHLLKVKFKELGVLFNNEVRKKVE